MLPNPAKVFGFAHQTAHVDSSTMRYQLRVPPLLATPRPVYHDNRRVTVEDHIVSLVRGSFARAHTILAQPEQEFDVEIALIDTHKAAPFTLDLGYLCDTLTPSKTSKDLGVESDELGITVEQHGASSQHNKPSVVRIGILRHKPQDI